VFLIPGLVLHGTPRHFLRSATEAQMNLGWGMQF
jgi:hypothetical protein